MSKRNPFEINYRKEECCGCGACAEICGVNAIQMVQDEEGFYYPQVNRSACIDCGQCKAVCPLKHDNKETKNNSCFGVRANDDEIRQSSSSGGFFSVLAEYILLRQGLVYGAGYDTNMNVLHKEVDAAWQLDQIKKTKYVQSSMRGVYQCIEKRLLENRWVLFSGTPCQTHALNLFLKRSYDRLITVDLVCYGVPSPGIWRDYVKYLEKKHNGVMTDFLFRDKRNSDNGHTYSYVIDGREYTGSLYNDKYCMMYFTNLTLRPSCHQCRFCSVDRDSDFTIGDFWGIERVRPDMNDGMGTSAVIIHTKKALDIWEQIKKDLIWFECGMEEVSQPRLHTPTVSSKNRGLFMLLYKLLPFSLIMKLMDHALRLRRKLH